MTRGEMLVLRLSGDLMVDPGLLMESEEIVSAIREKIRAGADYGQILERVSELV